MKQERRIFVEYSVTSSVVASGAVTPIHVARIVRETSSGGKVGEVLVLVEVRDSQSTASRHGVIDQALEALEKDVASARVAAQRAKETL